MKAKPVILRPVRPNEGIRADYRRRLEALLAQFHAAIVEQVKAAWIEDAPLAMGGFGGEVREAMKARTEHLIRGGLARRQGEHVTFERDLLATLRRRELDETATRISTETGLRPAPAGVGEPVVGVYRQRLTLSSGRFAMIDDGLGFQLVPWSPSLEKKLGQHVAGAARDDGGIEWSLGRRRGLGL